MDLSTVIRPKDVILDLAAPNKASLIGRLSAHVAVRTGLDEASIRTALLAREELGSTGSGGRVAIPHATLSGLKAPVAVLAVLKKPVADDAVDGLPVDIVFLLQTPAGGYGEYLRILSSAARRIRKDSVLEVLRNAASPEAVHAAFLEGEP